MIYKVLILTVIGLVVVSAKDLRCDIKKVDRCAQVLYIYGNPDYTVSNNVHEAHRFCNSTKEAEMCIKTYSQSCVKPFSRQYINLLLAGPTQQLKKRCNQSGIKKYLEHKVCVNVTKPAIDICNNDAIQDTMRILKARKEDWIQLSCCFLSKSTQCSTKAIDDEDLCDDRSKDYMKEAIRGFSGEVFDLFCGNDLHWESNNCQKVTKNLPPIEAKTKKPLSVFPVVLEMMERF